MGPDFEVDANDPATSDRLLQARVEDQRSAMCHPSLDDDIRLDPIDGFLDADHVLWQLNDRSAKPSETVHVFGVPAATQPSFGNRGKCLWRVEWPDPGFAAIPYRDRCQLFVDFKLHPSPPSRLSKS